jgi:hypothetical protein
MTSRNFRTRLSGALAVLLAIVVAACGVDMPSAPRAPTVPVELLSADDQGDLAGIGGHSSNVRLFACATPDLGSVTQRVGPKGGLVRVGPHILIIPRGALQDAIDITASAPAGPHVRVTFGPQGQEFRTRPILVLSYKHCTSHRPRRPKIAYVDDVQGSILELLPSKHIKSGKAVATSLRHFSGYAIAD